MRKLCFCTKSSAIVAKIFRRKLFKNCRESFRFFVSIAAGKRLPQTKNKLFFTV